MKKLGSVRKQYIYDKPECRFTIMFFLVCVFSYLFGALLSYVDFFSLVGDNKFVQFESNSVVINLIAGSVLTYCCTNVKDSLVWLKDKVYKTKPIEYNVKSDLFPEFTGECDANYIIHKRLQEKIIAIALDAKYGDQHNHIVFLPSIPGMGKTIFLKQISRLLTGANFSVSLISNYESLPHETSLLTDVVIFDDFDDFFLDNRDQTLLRMACETAFNSNSTKIIVFAFSSEYLSDTIRFSGSIEGKREIVFFEYDSDDINEIEKRLCKSIGIDWSVYNNNVATLTKNHKLRVVNSVMDGIKKGSHTTLAEVSILSRILSKESEDVIRKWYTILRRRNYDDKEFYPYKYLMDIVYRSPEMVITLIILHSLAKTSMLKEKLLINDLQNICYTENDLLEKTIIYLEDAQLIQADPMGYTKERRLKISSKFWITKIYSVAKYLLDATVLYNIEAYFEMKDSKRYVVTSTYEDFVRGTSYIKKLLCYAIPICALLNIHNFTYCDNVGQYLFFAELNLLAGLTVLYNFNYVYHFLIPCKKEFWLNSLISLVFMVIMYINYEYWFLCWGLGMLVQVLSLVLIDRKIFAKDIAVFTMIGCLVSGLGYGLQWSYSNSLSESFSYLIPYVKIASMSIVIAIMIGALARHILITYLVGNIMKVKNRWINSTD